MTSSAAPDYTVSLVDPSVRAVRGQTAELVVGIEFLDGFASSGITLQVPQAPGAASFTPAALSGEGGSLLRIDTGALDPGVYNWHVQAVSDGSIRSAPFTLEVIAAAELEFYTFDAGLNKITLSSLSPTSQSVTEIYLTGRGSDGFQFATGTPITLTSGNPEILAVYPHPDGHFRVYAIDSGSTLLTATAPDGYSRSIPVSIDIPSQPRITEMSVSPSTVTNRGDETITFTATGTGPLTSVAYDGLTLTNDSGFWYNDGRSYIGAGCVPEGLPPGSAYLFRAQMAPDTVRVVPLTVVNDPTRGMIRGAVYPRAPGGPGAVSGRIEVYDTGGVVVADTDCGREFGIGYLPPGTYKLRFAPSDEQALRPEWWPNADSFESASDVIVTAGGTVDGIYFFPSPPDEPQPPRIVSTAPADGEIGVVRATITAVFSRPMDVSTLNSDTFRVADGQGSPVSGTITCPDGITAVFTPSVPLADGATFTCTVTTGAADTEGLPLAQDHSWSFSTAADADLLSEARELSDGVSVALGGKIVHLHQGGFAYIAEPDRSSGMRIEGTISDASDRSVVSLTGVVATTPGGERYIDVRSLTVSGEEDTRPVGVPVRALDSRMMDGLCVRAWGRVYDPGASSFVLSDGSGSQGVIVITPEPHGFAEGAVVSVTGAAGWEGRRVIYAETVGTVTSD